MAIFSPAPLPTVVDYYTQLVFLYQEHALITVNGWDEASHPNASGIYPPLVSVDLHTHADPSAQEIWFRMDLGLFA
jgi:hypothetical protein